MGVWEEIVDYTVPSNTTDVVLNNFGTITKNDFIKFNFTIITNGTSQSDIQFNNDSNSANYIGQQLSGSGSSVSAFKGNFLSYSQGPHTNVFSGVLKISENDKVNTFINHFVELTSGLSNVFSYNTTLSSFPSGITSITFKAIGGATDRVATGSRFQIYKLAAEKVADVVVASNTTQVDITGLDIKKGDEYLLVSDIVNSGTTAQISLTPNDLTTLSNYYDQVLAAFGTTPYAERNNIPRLMFLPSNINSLAYTHIKISNIGAYTHQSYSILEIGTSAISLGNEFVSSTFENLTSINKLNVISSLSNRIGSGSRFTLYKLYEGGN